MSDLKVNEWFFSFRDEAVINLNVGEAYARGLENLIRKEPEKGIRNITVIYKEALDKAFEERHGDKFQRSYIEALSGGPKEEIPRLIYNAVGSVYPELDREMKDLALKQLFTIFDRMRYDYVQYQVAGIREPLLLSDIYITKRLYWPGLDEGKKILEEYEIFEDLRKDLIDEDGFFFHFGLEEDTRELFDSWTPETKFRFVNSDFVVAYSILRSGECNKPDFGSKYIRIADPDFLNRVMKGIVGMRFANTQSDEEIVAGRKRLEELLPEPLHGRIDYLRKEGGWAEPDKFRR